MLMITQVARSAGLALRARRPRAVGMGTKRGSKMRGRDELRYTSIKDGVRQFGSGLTCYTSDSSRLAHVR